MMFGATLGGNTTLIGAAANILSVGVCARNGKPVTFVTWLRYGLPTRVVRALPAGLFYLMR